MQITSMEFINTNDLIDKVLNQKPNELPEEVNKKLDVVLNNIRQSKIEKEKVFYDEKAGIKKMMKSIEKKEAKKTITKVETKKKHLKKRKRKNSVESDENIFSLDNLLDVCSPIKDDCQVTKKNQTEHESRKLNFEKIQVEGQSSDGSICEDDSKEMKSAGNSSTTHKNSHTSVQEHPEPDRVTETDILDNLNNDGFRYASVFNSPGSKTKTDDSSTCGNERGNSKNVSNRTLNKLSKFSFTSVRKSNELDNTKISSQVTSSQSVFTVSDRSDDESYDFNI